ncbi:MAG: hypothetical protein JWN04_5222 [Myxococcaceae bacterium]|nr:hypothetical protein [Myxococcaceae bacterium]
MHLLSVSRLGVRVVRSAEHRDEQLDLDHLAGGAVHEVRVLTRVVDEQLVAGQVVLTHHEPAPLLKSTIAIAEGRADRGMCLLRDGWSLA